MQVPYKKYSYWIATNYNIFFQTTFFTGTTEKRTKSNKSSSIVFNPNISKILAFEDFADQLKIILRKNIFEKIYILNPYLSTEITQ